MWTTPRCVASDALCFFLGVEAVDRTPEFNHVVELILILGKAVDRAGPAGAHVDI